VADKSTRMRPEGIVLVGWMDKHVFGVNKTHLYLRRQKAAGVRKTGFQSDYWWLEQRLGGKAWRLQRLVPEATPTITFVTSSV